MPVAVSKVVLTIGKNKEPIELTLDQLRELKDALDQLLGAEKEVHHYHEGYRPWWTWTYNTTHGRVSNSVFATNANVSRSLSVGHELMSAKYSNAGVDLGRNQSFGTTQEESDIPTDGVVHLTLNE